MCGRYEYDAKHREVLAKMLGVDHRMLWVDSDADVRPGTRIQTCIEYGSLKCCPGLEWGLLPSWASKNHKPRPINARAETIDTNRYFAEAFKYSRCLIPASAYFEWATDRSGKRK